MRARTAGSEYRPGSGNRQVANRVFLSPHTAALHLRHTFWKLGVT